MKAIILLTTIIFVIISVNFSCVSMNKSLNPSEKPMSEDQFLKIVKKVIVFFKKNPDKNNLSLESLLKEGVINKDDYDFVIKNKIKYNLPSTAGPNDNFLSIFDRENEDCTSSHILYNLVDTSDPSITKAGNISSLNGYLTEWYEYKSNEKTIYIFNNDDFYYFTIWYTNNEHWDKQHGLSINFPESNKLDIERFKSLLNSKKLKYRDYVAQSDLHLRVMLPPDLSIIRALCTDILESIYSVKPNDVINCTPDGFRFKED